MTQTLPKIEKLTEVGAIPFQYLDNPENILQWWCKDDKKTKYLFKTDSGAWGYYDKLTTQVIEINQWKGKAAMVEGKWCKLTLYHRVHVRFSQPVIFTGYDPDQRKKIQQTAQEAIILLTDTAFKTLGDAMKGRDANSYYRLSFTTRNKPKGGTMTYVDRIIWVEPIPPQST